MPSLVTTLVLAPQNTGFIHGFRSSGIFKKLPLSRKSYFLRYHIVYQLFHHSHAYCHHHEPPVCKTQQLGHLKLPQSPPSIRSRQRTFHPFDWTEKLLEFNSLTRQKKQPPAYRRPPSQMAPSDQCGELFPCRQSRKEFVIMELKRIALF